MARSKVGEGYTMKKEKELYEDVLREEPIDKKEYKKWEKRLHKSIGWVEPEEHHEVILEKSKKDNEFGGIKLASSPLNSKIHWDVSTGEGGFTCKDQEHAMILSLVLQMNERLKRMEKKG